MFMDLIRKRRSTRRFRDTPVEKEKLDLLLEAALRAPSSRGFNPWEFIVVADRAMLDRLSRAKPHGASFLKDAPLGIVVLADPARCDVWVEDCAIATIFIQLAAEALGLGSCWIQIRRRRHADGGAAGAVVRELLAIPGHLEVAAFVAVGYPDEATPPHPPDTLQHEKVHLERY